MNYISEVIISKVLRSPPSRVWPLWNICVTNDHGYVPLVVHNSRSFPHSWLNTGFIARLTRRVPLVEQEQLILPGQLSSPPFFSGVRVTRFLVLYVCLVDRCLSFCTFTFGHCVVCSSSIYGFWLPLWYLQTLLRAACKSPTKTLLYIMTMVNLRPCILIFIFCKYSFFYNIEYWKITGRLWSGNFLAKIKYIYI